MEMRLEQQEMIMGKILHKPLPGGKSEYRNNPAAIAKCVNDAISTGDSLLITKAIGDMVRAQNMTGLSQKAKMSRGSLYRSFNCESQPPFESVLNVLFALGIRLEAKPSDDTSGSGSRPRNERNSQRPDDLQT
jgi:probable addiction module antidote protein